MRLRLILLLLAGLTFLSITVGGYFYVSTLHSSLVQKTTEKSTLQAVTILNRLSEFLSAHLKTVRVLAGLKEIEEALAMPDEEHLLQVNNILDKFNIGLEVDVCYLMDIKGNTLASSNRHASDSFVGKNFAFRPYFTQALNGTPATYMALGSASAKRGAYYSYPVYDTVTAQPLGVVVIKASVERLEKEFSQSEDGIALMTDPNGIIFIASDKRLLLQALWPLSPDSTKELTESRQFGTGPWPWSGLTGQGGNAVTDKQQTHYEMFQQSVAGFPGWQVVYLRNAQAGLFPLLKPLFKATGAVVIVFILLIGALVYILYLNASTELRLRRTAEDALRENESRSRSLYHKTPALLQSFDQHGTLLSVSDYWLEVMGYSRDEVIGHLFTDYIAAAADDSPAREILQSLEEKGFCSNIACQFMQKEGRIMDIHLSAVADRDAQGKIRQSLAVLIDVTEQKKTALKLKTAKEELSRYSRELEGQVRERTREINNILRYTPALVTLKDKFGRYLLANSRFEDLFGVKASSIRGKTDLEIFPEDLAKTLRANDRQILSTISPQQFEEVFPLPDGVHTYLSTKFPLFDDEGAVSGVGSIATDISSLKKKPEITDGPGDLRMIG